MELAAEMERTVAGVRDREEPGLPGEPGRRALYFCGSIRGGREDRELYGRIVSRLRRFGTVLTEHVATAELEAHGEAAGERGSGCRGGVGPTPLHRNCPSPRKWAQTPTPCVCVQLRCEPSLRTQLCYRPLVPSWRTFLSSFHGAFTGRAE